MRLENAMIAATTRRRALALLAGAPLLPAAVARAARCGAAEPLLSRLYDLDAARLMMAWTPIPPGVVRTVDLDWDFGGGRTATLEYTGGDWVPPEEDTPT